MLETAKKSSNYSFRYSMYKLLEKAFIPKGLRQPGIRGLGKLQIKGQVFTMIEAIHTRSWKLKIRCLRWMEDLKLTSLILFVKMAHFKLFYFPRDAFLNLNQRAYNDLIKFISPKRIAISGRVSEEDDLEMVDLPKSYDVLDIHSPDFKLTQRSVKETHQEISDHLDDLLAARLLEVPE